jgi:hypothetical protein
MTCTSDCSKLSASFVSLRICSVTCRPLNGGGRQAALRVAERTTAIRDFFMLSAPPPPATERSILAEERPVSLTMEENKPCLVDSSCFGLAYSAALPASMTCIVAWTGCKPARP